MSHVDLSTLRIEGNGAPPRPPLRHRLVTACLLAFALALVATFVVPAMWSPRAVPMVDVQLAPTSGGEAPTAAIAEAAGWVEPDPFAVLVRPLVAGRVESIAVLEGATVKAGETVLAQLASATLQAAHERAQAQLREREQDLAHARAQASVAAAQLVQLAGPRQALLDAERLLAERTARLVAARGTRGRAEAEARLSHSVVAAQQALQASGGSYAIALARAEAAAFAADATANAAGHELAALEREVAAATDARELAAERLANPVELQGAVAVAEAQVERATAALGSARTEAAIAARELAWTTVKAPCDGVVLRLHAAPGAAVGPQGDPLLMLYDPTRLRARIDVPLASAGSVHEGQAVELHSELLGSTVLRGTVQRLQRESDLLKNTLQVKVALQDPPALLRPETLCRARFLASSDRPTGAVPAQRTFRVPRAAVRDGMVFRFDPTAGRARAVPITVVGERDDHVLVRGELAPTQRLILVPVQDGEAVREERR